jgi:hypothetical protein
LGETLSIALITIGSLPFFVVGQDNQNPSKIIVGQVCAMFHILVFLMNVRRYFLKYKALLPYTTVFLFHGILGLWFTIWLIYR